MRTGSAGWPGPCVNFFYEEIDVIIGIQVAFSPAILLESSRATSPETLDLTSGEH